MSDDHPDHPDRARVFSLVDRFFDHLAVVAESVDNLPDQVSLDEFTLVAMVTYTDEDDDACERVVMASSSKRPFVQLGLLEAATLSARNRATT